MTWFENEANRGIVGINANLEVFGGYDKTFYGAWIGVEREFEEPIPNEQRRALADRMIELWMAYKAANS